MHALTTRPALMLATLLGVAGGLHAQDIRGPLVEEGRALAAELGCGACHAGVPGPDQARTRAPSFGPQATPVPADFVFSYLADPQPRRTELGRTRMPDFHLHEDERVALALYLGSGSPGGDLAAAAARHPGASPEDGRLVFDVLGCAGCHTHPDHGPGQAGPDLSNEWERSGVDWIGTYLADPRPVRGDGHPANPGARMPDFRLTPDEATALGMYLSRGTPSATPELEVLTPFQMARTERLVKERLACTGCHVVDGGGGRIGPSLDGLQERRLAGYVLSMITDPAGTAPESGMPRQHLEARDARRVAGYLLQREGSGAAPQPAAEPYQSLLDPAHPARLIAAADAAQAEGSNGEALYVRHCASCHGTQGRGDGFNARNLPVPPTNHTDAELMARRPDDTLFDGIHAGAWVLDGSSRMPPFGEMFTVDQTRSLVSYIRTLCDCQGPEWSRGGGR